MAKATKTTIASKISAKLSGTEQVAAFFEQTAHPLKPAMEILRDIILSANKKLTEQIKWKAPSFCFDGDDRITFNLYKSDSLLLIFHRGAKVKDTKGKAPLFTDSTGLLEWLADDRAMVKFTSEDDVLEKKEKLKKLVNTWIKETSL